MSAVSANLFSPCRIALLLSASHYFRDDSVRIRRTRRFTRLDECGKKPRRHCPTNKEIKCERRKEEGDEGTTRWFKAPVFPSGSRYTKCIELFELPLNAGSYFPVVCSPLRPISNLLSDEYWIHCVSVGERIQRLCDDNSRPPAALIGIPRTW